MRCRKLLVTKFCELILKELKVRVVKQLIENLLVDTPLMIAIFDSSLKCDHLSRPWAQLADIKHDLETAPKKLGIPELFEPGSRIFVEHRIKTAFNKNQELSGVPANIHTQQASTTRGTLAILPMNLKSGIPTAVAVIFSQESLPANPATTERRTTAGNPGNQLRTNNGVSQQNGVHHQQSKTDLREQKLNLFLADQIDREYKPLLGESDAARRIREQVETIAQTNATVLIEGELGTGKEAIARAIHRQGARLSRDNINQSDDSFNSQARPFIKINCCSINAEHIESELFGDHGIMPLVDGGTLFLKEVSALPIDLQSRLMSRIRSLQIKPENQLTRGDLSLTDASPINARIIASTTKNLQQEVSAGRFNEHLFRRLNVFPISAPRLRDRSEDIFPLTQRFVESTCRETCRALLTVTNDQIRQLVTHDWPGNILELKSLIKRAVLVSTGNHLRLDLVLSSEITSWPHDRISEEHKFFTETEFLNLERKNVLLALRFADWRVSGPGGAAELLGIKPSTLNYRMKKLNIVRDSQSSHSQQIRELPRKHVR